MPYDGGQAWRDAHPGVPYQGDGVSYYGGYVKGSAANKDATGQAVDWSKEAAGDAKDWAGGAVKDFRDYMMGGDGWVPRHYPYDESQYDQHRQNQAGAREDQGWLVDQYRRQASGYGPSVARTQLAETTAANQQQQIAMARSGSGPLGQAGNRYEAARNSAGINQAANRQAASLRAQETALAMQGMGQTAGQMRGQDINMLDTEQGYQVGKSGVHAQLEASKAQQSESEAQRRGNASMFGVGAASALLLPKSDEKSKRAPGKVSGAANPGLVFPRADGWSPDAVGDVDGDVMPSSSSEARLLEQYGNYGPGADLEAMKGLPGPYPDDRVLQKGAGGASASFPSRVFGDGGALAPMPPGGPMAAKKPAGNWSWAKRPDSPKTKSEKAAAKAKADSEKASSRSVDSSGKKSSFEQGQIMGGSIGDFVRGSDERMKTPPAQSGQAQPAGAGFDPKEAFAMLKANQQATKFDEGMAATREEQPEYAMAAQGASGGSSFQNGQATGGAIGGLISKASSLFSDKRVKKPPTSGPRAGIPEADPRDMDRFLGDLKPYEFRYKHGIPGENPNKNYVGVMAQDAERTKAGSSFVLDGPDGLKRLDAGHGFGTALAAMGRLNERLERLEQRGRRGGK